MADIWTDRLLLTLKETPHKTKPGCGYGLFVVQKLRNGQSFNVQVRSGYFSTSPDGEKKLPKDGLGLYDFNTIGPIFKDQIKPLLENPPAVPLPGAEEPVKEVGNPWE